MGYLDLQVGPKSLFAVWLHETLKGILYHHKENTQEDISTICGTTMLPYIFIYVWRWAFIMEKSGRDETNICWMYYFNSCRIRGCWHHRRLGWLYWPWTWIWITILCHHKGFSVLNVSKLFVGLYTSSCWCLWVNKTKLIHWQRKACVKLQWKNHFTILYSHWKQHEWRTRPNEMTLLEQWKAISVGPQNFER